MDWEFYNKNMEKEPKDLEKKELATPRPSLLDIIKLEDRLAQVVGGGDIIRYLDDKTIAEVNWNEYEYEEAKPPYVWALLDNKEMSDSEYLAIHWDSSTEEPSQVKQHVTFFGRYKKKK